MVQTCSRCSRINPEEASYCYYDGSVLRGHDANGGPIHTGSQTFHNPFTFPSGQLCRNFDELGLACQENWLEALELLQQGYLESFLGGLGRADLALAAREAARFPDHNQGLDQLLAKLPSDVVKAPRLDVEPTEVNLGQMEPGEDRQLELHLTNQGMRLLYGSVTCDDSVWLTVGEGYGTSQKLFQFTHELDIPLHVRGKFLQGSRRPLEGRLLIESNGGTATVMVRAEVPVKPFPEGLFAGALSPRQVADLAKEHLRSHLKETAALFENGTVAQWYQDNGWTYPVQGPVAEGASAVQQFFDALGLSRPPRVEISDQSVLLRGNVGVPLQHVLEIKAHERRPIYAHAFSDQPWLEVGRARLNGRTASLGIPLVVPAVPDREGETLRANVTIIANSKQRFIVPVTLEVGGNLNFGPISPVIGAVDIVKAPEPPALAPAVKPMPEPVPESVHTPPLGKHWLHAIPAVLLGLALFGVVVWDLRSPRKPGYVADDDTGGPRWILEDPEPRIGLKFNKRMRFGIVMLKEKDPENPDKFKRLTMAENGWSNNTCIRLDGHANLFGQEPGEWARDAKGTSLREVQIDNNNRRRWTSTWLYTADKVRVRQIVEIVPNEQSRLLDTCLVHYRIDNEDTITHKVGIRIMLDTFIGSNDGVPFAIPGQKGLLETMKVFDQKEIPDYIEAMERPNLTDPGTIAHMGLKIPSVKFTKTDPDLEALEKLVICRWPGNSEKRWDWEYKAMNDPPEKKDSCVVLYWEEQLMEPNAKRAMAFTYGLGRIASSGSGQLGLTVGGSFQPGKVFTVTAYVKDPEEGQKVKLILPRSMSLAPGEDGQDQKEEQTVEKGGDYSQVSWRVKPSEEGMLTLEVASGRDLERVRVQIKRAGLFD
jgi:hypothetical protein